MDISSLSIAQSTVLHLAHPVSGEKLFIDVKGKLTTVPTDKAVTITVASTSSREYRVAIAAMQNRKIKRGTKPMTAEIQREEGIELLTAVCLNADNLDYKGKAVKTTADFRALLADDGLSWIKGQIDETVGAVELFIAESLTQ